MTAVATHPGAWSDSPWRMPRAAWKQVLSRTWAQVLHDNVSLAAAGVAFYGFTAMVPLLGAIVLSYGLVADPAAVVDAMRHLTSVMPVDAAKLIGDQLMNIVKTSSDKKGFGLLLAMAVALYGVRSGAAAVITGLNIAYDEEEHRSFLKLTMITLATTVSSLIVALLALVAITTLGHLEDLLPSLPSFAAMIGKIASYVLLVLTGAAGAATLYRYGPDRAKARWIWITPGSLLAASVWLLLSILFGIYVADFGNYNATYGSLGAVVVFLTWLYLSSYVLLLGAELNAEVERQTRVDTTVGPAQPEGQRGASVADGSVTPVSAPPVAPPIPQTSSTPPLTSQPPSNGGMLSTAGTMIATTSVARVADLPQPGFLPAILATAGLSALRTKGHAGIGLVILSAGGLIAFARRR